MSTDPKAERAADPAAVVLGYLNFSSGAFDPAAWRAMSELYAAFEPDGERPDAAEEAAALLERRLATLAASEPAFRDVDQARGALARVFGELLPAYRRFHADLLEHQPPGAVERPFFVMAAAQALLAGGGPGAADAVERAVARLNDYVGWRPVAALENGRLSDPYPHERVRPVPVFVAGAGVAHGRYRALVSSAVDILRVAPEALLRQADFELDALEELAIDPRAFDFLHPAASRPNYLFGLWDPARIDQRGRYRRMVVQQATLDGILSWPDAAAGRDGQAGRADELRLEAGAVLAGVMLMASGLSGHGPGAHLATAPLSELLPRIAGYRDEFYRWMLGTLPPAHRARLDEETARLRQPFGGVRRHINTLLAGRRARQVEAVALAGVFARLGRAGGAERMASLVPAASARLFARITSLVVAARHRATGGSGGDLGAALDALDGATETLFRAVGCGAAVDPWNILGFSGQFPLHEPGGESLADPRVDDLVATVGSILEGFAGVWRAASLDGPADLVARAGAACERLAAWWDRHATTTVGGVPHLSGRELLVSSREVIGALSRRRETAPSPPPPGFWRGAVAEFSSPQSHAHAAEALLREGDLDGAMGLLVHWASLLEGVEVERLGATWLAAAGKWLASATADRSPAGRNRVRRFLELVEANTSGIADAVERFAERPRRDDPRGGARGGSGDGGDEERDEEGSDAAESVASAYESMVWRDSTDDGVDGGMLDVDGGGTPGELAEVEHAAEFLGALFRLLRDTLATLSAADVAAGTAPDAAELDAVAAWGLHLRRVRRALVAAARVVVASAVDPPAGTPASEADRIRWQRDAAAERLVEAAVQGAEASWMLSARRHVGRPAALPGKDRAGRRGAVGRLFAALLAGDAPVAAAWLGVVRRRLAGRAVLYVPLARGGRPDRIVAARSRERLLERLVACLPRLGMVAETSGLVHVAKALEAHRPPGRATVSEFDRVFEAAATALVERIVTSAAEVDADGTAPPTALVTERILDGLSLLVPRLLDTWTTHARQLRLSILERVRDQRAFTALREFVETYGAGLFTQHFLVPPSLRGILRGGVRRWLEDLVERHTGEPADVTVPLRPRRLLEDLASGALPMRTAVARIRLALECVAENHAEYRDWNSTTTQSDRGEFLHVFLDFLRLKAEYDRIAWTLRPVNMAHRVLARRGVPGAAEAWRGRLRDETHDTAAGIVERLGKLEAQWGVRLASVADRLRRPFSAVLEQDDLEALVEPAVRELCSGAPEGAGARFEARAEGFIGVAGGSGVEIPEWLERLGQSVDQELDRRSSDAPDIRPLATPVEAVPWRPMRWEDLRAALDPAPPRPDGDA
ncbi:MAG: hypothetical protein ACKO3G_15670 [Planctomycetaceae bacterium]